MDAKALKEVTSGLSILYVEDDDDLREETSRLFGHLFENIETAANGRLALERLDTKEFDLIVTDINMPVMDGIEFTKHVREKDEKQTIIVTSAHDETHYLLELIELGIDKFILKPFEMGRLVTALTQVCSNIMNEKLIRRYKEEIESSNIQLKASNQELEILIKVLDTKIEQLNRLNQSQSKEENSATKTLIESMQNKPSYTLQDPSNINENGLYLYKDYMDIKDLKELSDLEHDINTLSTLIDLQESIDTTSILQLSLKLGHYADLLHKYPIFSPLSDAMQTLAHSLKEDTSVVTACSSDILILLKSFMYILKKWRVSLFETGIKNPHMYDMSMLNDIQTMIIILQKDESLQRNHDFF